MQRRDEEIESVAAVEARLLAVRLEQRRLTQTVMELRARIESLQIREREQPAAAVVTPSENEQADIDVSERGEPDAAPASVDAVCSENTGAEVTQTQTDTEVTATGSVEDCVAEAGVPESA
jgi:hypothetical protein